MLWLPFFSNCQNFGKKLVLYNLLESPLCDLKSIEETVVVYPFPFDGIEPNADSCDYFINCIYDDDVSKDKG